MDKEQRDAIVDEIEKKAKEQGLAMLKDVPAGARCIKWNLRRNEPETINDEEIGFTIITTRPGDVRGFVFITFEQDDGEEGAGNFHGTDLFKVVG